MKKGFLFLFLGFLLCFSSCKGFANKNISNNPNILIVYDSRYGATKLTSEWIAEGIKENVKVLYVGDFKDKDLEGVDFLLIGSPIFKGEIVTANMANFIKGKKERLSNIPVGLFTVCGTYLVWGDEYLKNFENLVKNNIPNANIKFKKAFGGRIIPEKLNDSDKEKMDEYWRSRGVDKIKKEDFMDKEVCVRFGREVKEMLIASLNKEK